ncbi:MAG: hypothetical protein M0P31_17735 [Solirubrobacteraceae bacterium]|nr:hypothetical protein [Solirubrobacteraceae bacterium]
MSLFNSARPTASAGPSAVGTVPLPSRRAARALPRELSGIRLHEVPGPVPVGVIEDRRRERLTAVIRVEGGAFALAPTREQEARLRRWGDLVAALAGANSCIRRIGFISRSIPSDTNRQLDYFEEAADPRLSSDVRDSYLELLERYQQTADQREVLLWISANRGGGDLEPQLAELREQTEHVTGMLGQAKIRVVGVLDRLQAWQAIRSGYDPWGRADREEFAERVRRQAPQHVGDLMELGPSSRLDEWSYVHADRGLHRTAWVAQWPSTEVGSLFFLPMIVNPYVVRAVAWVAELRDPGAAIRHAGQEALDASVDARTMDRMGQRPTVNKQQRWAGAFRRERELGAGHAEVHHAAYVTTSVLGDDLGDLERAWARTETNAAAAKLRLQVLAARQADALTLTLPLGRGLR